MPRYRLDDGRHERRTLEALRPAGGRDLRESIQVAGRLRVQIADFTDIPPMSVSMQLHSYFAPKTHVRPEWFGAEGRGFYGPGSTIPRFPGGEDKGA